MRAQSSEFGALVGTTFYLGDLNQARLFKNSHLAGGFMYRYNISPRWAIKADFLFGKVSASDAGTLYAKRNLSFMSPITELSIQAELNFLKLYNAQEKGVRADACVSCNACLPKCPQHISIPQHMERIRGLAAKL